MTPEKRFHYLIDDDLELRLLEGDDAQALLELTRENRDYLGQWLPWVEGVESLWDVQRYIHSSHQQFSEDRGFQTAIWFRGSLVGIVGYQSVDWINRAATLGYWLGEEFQGKGLVTRSCEALVDWGFRRWGLNRVEIRCSRENHRSRAVPARLGFIEEGVAREAEWLHDHFSDLILYSTLARDWPGIRFRNGVTERAGER